VKVATQLDQTRPVNYSSQVIEVKLSDVFSKWLGDLRDRVARSRILSRLDRLALGRFGDFKSVGDGVGELRVDHGPGYRLYFVRRGKTVVIVLCGGDKSNQSRDIAQAKALAKEF
jgi:putative addiction module killer protein